MLWAARLCKFIFISISASSSTSFLCNDSCFSIEPVKFLLAARMTFALDFDLNKFPAVFDIDVPLRVWLLKLIPVSDIVELWPAFLDMRLPWYPTVLDFCFVLFLVLNGS